eukprot:3704061-Rhodomonas_salina.3
MANPPDPTLLALLQATQAQLAAQQQANADNAAAIAALQATIAAQTQPVRPLDMATYSGCDDKENNAEQFGRKIAQYLGDGQVPQAKWAKWAASLLTHNAAVWFGGYPNPATGVVGDMTISWNHLETSQLAYSKASTAMPLNL